MFFFSFLVSANLSAHGDLFIVMEIRAILTIIQSVPFTPGQIGIKIKVVVLRKRIT